MKSMTRKHSTMLRATLLGAAVLVVAAASVQPAHTDENLNVSCYLDGSYLGTVMVFTPESAGSTCNSINYSCKGKCYGCFSDFDLGGDVCYDNAGRKFLR